MKKTAEERDAASFAKIIVAGCIRNTLLEDLHAGKSPVTKIGDFSDVKVIDGEGLEIPWPELARFNDHEMKSLIKEFVNRVYTLLLDMESDKAKEKLEYWSKFAVNWDEPEIDDFVVQALKKVKIGS